MSVRNKFLLGEWTVFPLEGRLQRGDETSRVQPKSMDVLLALAEAAGTVVGREDLLREIWGERAVTDEPLTRCIGELRRALGDRRQDPVYIETIPKRGYRLLVPVVDADVPPEAQETGRRGQPVSVRPLLIIAVAAVIGLLVYMSLWQSEPGIDSADRSTLAGGIGETPAIAVLPFLNLSPDPADAYLADGTAETLTHVLSRIEGLKVVARSSAFVFREAEDVRVIGDALRVDAVLEGSVQKQDDAMRITTQLVATGDGRHLWSAAYDRKAQNLFAVQDEIAGEVAAALQLTLLQGADAGQAGTDNFEAYREYLLGLERAQERTVESIAAAEQHFSRAMELDPDYALALVGYADSISLQHYYSNRPIGEIKALALPVLERALELDPQLGEAYAALGIIYFNAGDWPAAESALRRAVALSPNYARAWFGFGTFYNDTGRPAEALPMHLRALELNPLAPHINNAVGVAYEKLGRFDEAVAQFERTMEVAPDYGAVRYRLGMLLWNVRGDAGAAMRLYEQAIEMDPDNHWGPALKARLYLDLGDDGKAAEWLEIAEKPGERGTTAEVRALMLTRQGASGQQRLGLVQRFFDQTRAFGITARLLRIARDVYLEGQRPNDAIELFRRFHPEFFEEPAEINWVNFMTAVDLAYVLQLAGNQPRAEALLTGVESYIATIPRLGCCGYGLTDVEIAAIRGDTETALDRLEQAIAEGWKADWWWETDYNPNLSSLHDDERYRVAVASLASSMEQRRAAVARADRQQAQRRQ